MERVFSYPLGLCRPAHPPGYSVRAQFADKGHPFCFFDSAGEERMVRLDEGRKKVAHIVNRITVERENVAPIALLCAVEEYKNDWDWLAHQIAIREGSVYQHHTLGTSVGFGWLGSPVFTGLREEEPEVYSTYLYQFESLMIHWLLALALFTQAFTGAPFTSAFWMPEEQCGTEVDEEGRMTEGSERVRASALLYMKAYVTMASARVRYYQAFAKRTVLSQCLVAEATPEVMDAMMAFCQAMAARLVVSNNEALCEFRNHAPERSRKGDLDGASIRPMIATWGFCADMLVACRQALQASRYPGSPLERFCSTLHHMAMAKVYVLDAEYLLWKSHSDVALVGQVDRQLRCLELARRAGHLAYLHGTLTLLDELDGTRGGGLLERCIEMEVYEQTLPEASNVVEKAASWALMEKPLDNEDFQRTSSDTTYMVLPHFQREIREAVFDPPLLSTSGFACKRVLQEAIQWLQTTTMASTSSREER